MKKICFYLLLIILYSIAFSQPYSKNIKDIHNDELKENVFIYFLPKTVFEINITVETQYFIPGPFARFGEKYLTLRNLKTNESYKSEICKVEIRQFYLSDENSAFSFVNKKNNFSIELNSQGVIKSFNNSYSKANNFTFTETNTFYPKYIETYPEFTNISVQKNFTNQTDTTYNVILVDSIYQKIPIYNKKIVSKNFEQQAEEAADFIYTIRKRKFDQISGFFEIEQPSPDLEFMVKELNKLEKQYLELFTGKTFKIENTFRTFYIPENPKEETKILFYLSNQFGILPNIDADFAASPVQLYIKPQPINNVLNNFYTNQNKLKNKKQKSGLYYRIPASADIKIVCDNHTYYENKIIIPQYGYTNYLPTKFLKNKKTSIVYNEFTGSIISIKNE